MAKKINKYVAEVKNLIMMMQDGMLDIGTQEMIIEKVEQYYKTKKINQNERELLKRALGEKQ